MNFYYHIHLITTLLNLLFQPFSAIKSYISRHGGIMREAMLEKDDGDVYCLLCNAVYSVTESDAEG